MLTDTKLEFLSRNAPDVARQLIGWRLYVRESNDTLTGGTIIETEAYTQDDAASHSFRGKTARNEVMFGPAGGVYVYFTYGMHWCMNIVTGDVGDGQAVLIRSIVAECGIDSMRQRRGGVRDSDLTNGPAKLCQALAVSKEDNGSQINGDRIILVPPSGTEIYRIAATPRIGIKNGVDLLWRFVARAQ